MRVACGRLEGIAILAFGGTIGRVRDPYMIQGPLIQGANQWKVCEILSDFSWDWGRIPFDLPFKVKSLIQAIPILFE